MFEPTIKGQVARLKPEDFLSVKPLERAEFVIRSAHIKELNEPWGSTPAMVFVHDNIAGESSKLSAIAISKEEYHRLKQLLTGETTYTAEELTTLYKETTLDTPSDKDVSTAETDKGTEEVLDPEIVTPIQGGSYARS